MMSRSKLGVSFSQSSMMRFLSSFFRFGVAAYSRKRPVRTFGSNSKLSCAARILVLFARYSSFVSACFSKNSRSFAISTPPKQAA